MGAVASLLAAVAVFSQSGQRLVVQAPGYRVVLAADNGRILEVADARGRKVLGGSWGCMWEARSLRGCSFRVKHRWSQAMQTLTLTYGGTATVTLRARPTAFDLRLRLNAADRVRDQVRFPAGLAGDTRTVEAGYAPNVLPGVRIRKPFFARVANSTQIYPSRWAFADWLAVDAAGGHAAVYTVNRGPIAPVSVGFFHLAPGLPCSGRVFCLLHQFETWVKPGGTWTSPIVRVRVGGDARASILAYRDDNGIAAYPSLRTKLASWLDTLARAPLLKADVSRLAPFASWDLSALPSPVLLHPVAFQPRGHDENDPDFLPPDPRWGTTADFRQAILRAHSRGDLVMPYDNWSWWDPDSPTLQAHRESDVAVLDAKGEAETIEYGDHTGVIVSPWADAVRERAAASERTWTELGADCVFLDQVGARPWLRDFNPASPTPLAYDDGWLELLRVLDQQCVMVEDGWDRLARSAVGFHGGIPMLQRELGALDNYFGAGNWEPYPLGTWLFHDKVLMYQHDLYDRSLTIDGEIVAFNLAFGLVNSFEWRIGEERNPWLLLAARLQQDFGPFYAGVPLASFTTPSPGVTRSVFGQLTVEANIAAGTFTATAPGVTATGYPGGHYVIVEENGTVVRQPVGGDFAVSVPGTAARVVELPSQREVPFTVSGGNVTFTYRAGVDAYRILRQ
jgi:Domain of unknown function (DUF6259)